MKRWLNVNINGAVAVAGTFVDNAIGTLDRTEGQAFSLAIVSWYGDKVVFQNANMNAAWVFNFAIPVGSLDVGLGAKTKRERVVFRCIPVSNLYGGGTLYSNSVAGITLPTPT